MDSQRTTGLAAISVDTKDLLRKQGVSLSPSRRRSVPQAFSKIKGLLRRAEARTREALIEAMGRSLEAVSARDAHGFFGHCGYRSRGQLL